MVDLPNKELCENNLLFDSAKELLAFILGGLLTAICTHHSMDALKQRDELVKKVGVIREEAIKFFQYDAASYEVQDFGYVTRKIQREIQLLADDARNLKSSLFFYSGKYQIDTKIKNLRQLITGGNFNASSRLSLPQDKIDILYEDCRLLMLAINNAFKPIPVSKFINQYFWIRDV